MIRTTGARVFSLVLLGSLSLPGAGFVVAAEDADATPAPVRAPEPSALEREDAAKSIRQVFRSQYSRKGVQDRRLLGRELLAEAKKGNSADATRFELLSESRTIAAKAADLETALAAIDRLDTMYNVDRLAITEETLASFPRPRSLVGVIAIHKAWQDLVDHAIGGERYSVASRIAATAHKLIRKTRDKVLTREAKEREEFTESLEQEYKKISPSLQRLLDNPEDAAAQEKVAVFLCLHKREWTTGLPVAAKAPSTPLGAVAERDLANPREAAAQVAVGIDWHELADGYKDVPRISCLERAVRWFDSALVSLGQITRSDVEKRLAAIYKEAPGLRPVVGLDDLEVLLISGRSAWSFSYKASPLESMALSRAGDALRVKNTSGSSQPALLAEKTTLNGDFEASLELYGGNTLGLVSSSLRAVRLEIKLGKKGWQKVRVVRTRSKVTFEVNGRAVQPEKGGRWIPAGPQNMAGRFFVGLTAGQECRLRNFELRADLDAPEPENDLGDLDDVLERLRRGRGGDDGGRGRSGRGR